MSYSIFLDDIRNTNNKDYIVVRSYEETISLIEKKGCPKFISFDHDLGEDKNALQVVKWLIEKDLDSLNNKEIFIPDNFTFIVHSANPIGRKNIEEMLNGYLKFKNIIQKSKEINFLMQDIEKTSKKR